MSVPVPSEITAYAGESWDPQTHMLESGPYRGFQLGLCRADAGLGGRVAVAASPAGPDTYSADDLRNIQEILGITQSSGKLILDQESQIPGHICVYGGDRTWVIQMENRISNECKGKLGGTSEAKDKCAALEHTFHVVSGERSTGEQLVDGWPIALDFAAIGGVIAGIGVFIKNLFFTPRVPLMLLFDCNDPNTRTLVPALCGGTPIEA